MLILGPEQLVSPRSRTYFDDPNVLQALATVIIDKVHLTLKWAGFRKAYREIGKLRGRLAPYTTFIRLTATLAAGTETAFLQKHIQLSNPSIGRYPTARPELRLEWRTIQSAGATFRDLDFLLPHISK